MPFREKSAWISLVLIVLLFGTYFWRAFTEPLRGGQAVHWLLLIVVVFVVLEVALHIVVAIQAPRDARAPQDERERLIGLRATRIAYFTLMGGALLSIFSVHLGAGVRTVISCAFLSVVAAELVKFASQIVFFRRGA
jgi:hypothetical protein